MALKQTDIEIRSDETVKLTLRRAKTDVQTEMFLTTQAIKIIQLYECP